MSLLTVLLYVIAAGLWWHVLHREGGIGIGFRFLYAANLALFFLVGPLLEAVFGASDSRFPLRGFEPAVQLGLYGLMAYLAGAYLVYPSLAGRSRVIPPAFADWVANPERLEAQRRTGWALVAIGGTSLPLFRFIHGIPTVGAVLSQVHLLVETGLVMLCMYAVHARQRRVLAQVFAVVVGKALLFSAISGHLGGSFITGMFLVCLVVLSRSIRSSALVALALTGVIAFVPAQMWLAGRGRLRQAIQEGRGFQERVEIAVEIFLNPGASSEQDRNFVSAYLERGDYSTLLARAMLHTPDAEPFAMGGTYSDVVVAVVPRFLWPDKPFKAGGNEYVTRYTGVRFSEHTSVATHYLFEFYINFGTAGAVTGMFLLGLLLGWMESLYYRKANNLLFYEYCLVLCAWSVCIACDRIAMLAMTIPPAVVLCLSLRWVLRPYVPAVPPAIPVPSR